MFRWFRRITRKFGNAFRGFYTILREEKSLWFHLITTVLVVIFGLVFQIDKVEWLFLLTFIALVIGFEILNTGLEYIADIVSFEYNIKVKKIKDLGAAATLFAAILAVVVGLIIFIPYIIAAFNGETTITPTSVNDFINNISTYLLDNGQVTWADFSAEHGATFNEFQEWLAFSYEIIDAYDGVHSESIWAELFAIGYGVPKPIAN